MSERKIGEIKHTVSNVVGAVTEVSKKLTLLKIQTHYLLKRIEFLENKAGEKYVDPRQNTSTTRQQPQANQNRNVIYIN